jgi:hypothetical protein
VARASYRLWQELNYLNEKPDGRCGTCHVAWLSPSKDVPMSVSSVKTPTTPENIKSFSHTVSEGSTTAATAFTSLAWVIVALTFICTLIATFVIAADGDTFLAMMMFIGGCFSAVLLGLLTEISANIAKLVNNSR